MKKLYKASILTGLFWCFTIQAQTYSITEDSFSITQNLNELQTDYFSQNQGNSTAVEIAESERKAQRKYWSAERLQNAKPIDLPRVDESVQKSPFVESYDYEESVSEPGSKPIIHIKPNKTKLFQPTESEIQGFSENEAFIDYEAEIETYSYGTAGAHFTSSQVGPAPAAQNSWPFIATGKLFFTDASGRPSLCTASVIRRNLILTAGHCVYDAQKKQWYKNFKFIPAFHNGKAPYGTWSAKWIVTTDSWFSSNGSVPNRGDYALLEMETNSSGKKIGDVTGYYGYRTSGLHPNHVTMLGYPTNFDSGNWMHRVDSQSFQSTFFNTTEYGSDMAGGSSGGPWLENFGLKSVGQSPLPNGMNYVVGVTSYGSSSSGPKYAGSSTLDTQFTNSSKTGIIDVACARSTGNC